MNRITTVERPPSLAPLYGRVLLISAFVVPAGMAAILTVLIFVLSTVDVVPDGVSIAVLGVLTIAIAPFGLLFGLLTIAVRHGAGPVGVRLWAGLLASGALMCGALLVLLMGSVWALPVVVAPVGLAGWLVHAARRRLGIALLFEAAPERFDPDVFA